MIRKEKKSGSGSSCEESSGKTKVRVSMIRLQHLRFLTFIQDSAKEKKAHEKGFTRGQGLQRRGPRETTRLKK